MLGFTIQNPHIWRVQQYDKTLYEINEKGLAYKKEGNRQELDKQAELMQQNLKKVAQEALGLDIRLWHEYETYFPLRHASDFEFVHDDIEEICDVGSVIPMHLNKISKTERFKIFFNKYSEFPVTLDVMDERRSVSSLHYGLSANSTDGKYASTYFHINTCTNEITDEYGYVLICRDEAIDYLNFAMTEEDVMASIAHDDFCTIPLDSWRQSLHDYGSNASEISTSMIKESIFSELNMEPVMELHKEIDRLSLLTEISFQYYHGDIEKAEQETRKYVSTFGALPEDLQDIIDKRPVK